MTSQFRIDLCLDKGDEIVKFLSSGKFLSYYVSFEIGTATNKPHWQGWVSYDYTENSYRTKCTIWAKSLGLSGKTKQYCFGSIKDLKVYQSYIMNNTSKDLIKVFTNLESIYLDDLKQLPKFVPKQELNVKQDWYLKCYKELEDKCLEQTFSGLKINYPRIKTVILQQCSKNIDAFIFKRLLIGLSNKLEQNYNHPDNKMVSHMVDKWIKDDPDLNMFQ